MSPPGGPEREPSPVRGSRRAPVEPGPSAGGSARDSFGARLRARAREEGFDLVGVADIRPSDHEAFYRGWIAAGRNGEMAYLARADAVERRADLGKTLDGVRSAVVVAQGYYVDDPEGVPDDPSRGVIARYARGRDYHEVIAKGLDALLTWIRAEAGKEVRGMAYVDTGPILERELARRAGIGWFGRNTMLLNPGMGSYLFLGVLLLDVVLEPDGPFAEDRCGTCRACLDACPTGALLGRDETGAPVMDARLCISYLTIENRGPIPRELRPMVGNRIYGCDICQEVCPWNQRFAVTTNVAAYAPRPELDGPVLIELAERLLSMSEKSFLREYADSPVSRARRKGLLRNVCVGLGNWGSQEGLPVLVRALNDDRPLVRGHAAWALGRVGQSLSAARSAGVGDPTSPGASPDPSPALRARLEGEEDDWVRDECERALSGPR